MEPTVSIVVPIYNGEKYIDICMSCIQAQTYSNIEIILVDDGSTDQSGMICDSYAQKDSRVKVVHKENGGLSSARNAGIEASSGEYIYFYDVDDQISSELVKDNVTLAVENNADVVLFCFWYYVEDRKELIPNSIKENFVGDATSFFENMLTEAITKELFNAPWNKMIHRRVFQKQLLRFNTDYPIYEDIIFASELFPIAQKIVINREMYYTYYVRASGTLITRFYPNLFDAVSLYYKNILSYCNQYEHHEEQLERFNYLYTRLIITHLKQISCHKSLDKREKYQLMKKICNSELFVHALTHTKLTDNRRIVRFLIRHHMYQCIYYLYRFKA